MKVSHRGSFDVIKIWCFIPPYQLSPWLLGENCQWGDVAGQVMHGLLPSSLSALLFSLVLYLRQTSVYSYMFILRCFYSLFRMKTAFFLFDLAENMEREQQARLYELSYYVSRKCTKYTIYSVQYLNGITVLAKQHYINISLYSTFFS